jgi:hypothetical protein
MQETPRVHVIHENSDWSAPLFAALERRGIPHADWFIHERHFELGTPPPVGVFYNRMSASSHTRGHRYAPELTAGLLSWLGTHGRTVWNGLPALRLEISKIEQAMAFRRHGIPSPRTIAAVGAADLLSAARQMDGAFITKHNRAGKGLGVKLFRGLDAFQAYLESPLFEPSVDGITLIQEYIEAPEPFIVRMEFIGQRFVYAVRVDTSEGFELCPADACNIGDLACPATPEAPRPAARPKFEILPGFEHPLIPKVERLLVAEGVEVAGVEFITDRQGRFFVYDLNTNTNYNPGAEERAGVSAMDRLAGELGALLEADARPMKASA